MDGYTVAAVSTPKGKGGVAMIRISGNDAIRVASRVFKPAGKSGAVNIKELSSYKPNTAVYGRFFDEDTAFDDGIAILYKAPASFTGEDTVELCCHGGLLVTSKLLTAVLAAGAVPAGPGEFTKRAFINGKLSLSEAEAVAGIIDAVSEKHLGVSLLQLGGSLSRKIGGIYSKLAFLVSSVYAYIDYPDEDMTDVSADEMKNELAEILKELDALYESRRYGKAISEGVRAVIAGRPNTGKSSLLNLLSGDDRAIVTDIEGTTRDVITEKITVGDIVLNLSDTAGIRDGSDLIEKLGIERSEEAIKNAEIIILVLESKLTPGDEKVVKLIKDAGKADVTVALYNKTDLQDAVFGGIFKNEIAFSVKTGEGREELEKRLALLCGEAQCTGDGEVIVSARQFSAVKKARESVRDAINALGAFTQDIAGMDLETALAALGELDGRKVTEEVVDGIFSHFCVGK